ncbi:MAG: hypothetical protein IKJ73_01380 [Lachnospiraceae bacterium]|nr:hypothetical protein [Lachnospiraceae bacterium]
MYDVIMGLGTNVHILWGIGLLGLLIKLCVSFHMRSMIKASENMATTRKKSLRIMRQKYVNGRNLGINRGNGAAFVEKNIRRLKWAGLPLELWKRSGIVLILSATMVMSGSFLYYESRWRGSPEMVTLLANGVLVCAFLLVLENIFLINNKVEILKANIRDYLENLTLPPPKERISPEDLKEFADLRRPLKDPAKEIAAATEERPIDNDKMLDSFLKEFFS